MPKNREKIKYVRREPKKKYGKETTQGNKHGDEDRKNGETGNNAAEKE
jgi:hypothetical protein